MFPCLSHAHAQSCSAKSQLILLPGTGYTSAQDFVNNGSGAALLDVKNPDGTNDGLIFDVHKYLDTDNSCVLSCRMIKSYNISF